jgi:hypothetical protein
VVIAKVANRLPFLAALLADLAWTNGERSAHDAVLPPRAAEAEAVHRVFRYHVSERQRYPMEPAQRTAVLVYLDALLLEVTRCIEIEDHAPSATLGREARQFVGAVTELRRAAILQ